MDIGHRLTGSREVDYNNSGMGSSRTGLDLEDTSRTKFCGLGLGLGLALDDARPWLWLQDLAVRR